MAGIGPALASANSSVVPVDAARELTANLVTASGKLRIISRAGRKCSVQDSTTPITSRMFSGREWNNYDL